MMWDAAAIVATVHEAEGVLSSYGWHAALAGSCLLRGCSDHDLDLVVFPHDSSSFGSLAAALGDLGWVRTHTAPEMRERWRGTGSRDNKHVEVWRTREGRCVDVILACVATPHLRSRAP